MSPDRLGSGEKIADASAILLFVFMFLDWFGTKTPDDSSISLFSVGHSAWEALDYIPIVLLIAIVAALAVAVLRLTDVVRESLARVNAAVAILGIISALLILYRIVDPPGFGVFPFDNSFGPVPIEGTVQLPAFLGLLAALGIAFGGYRAMREEGISFASLRAGRLKNR